MSGENWPKPCRRKCTTPSHDALGETASSTMSYFLSRFNCHETPCDFTLILAIALTHIVAVA